MTIVASRIEKLDSVQSTFHLNLFFLFSAKAATACFNATRCTNVEPAVTYASETSSVTCRVLHVESGTHWKRNAMFRIEV